MPEKTMSVDPNNASYWFGKFETQMNHLMKSQESFQSKIESDIDKMFHKYRETNDNFLKLQSDMVRLDNKIEDTKMIVDTDTIKRQRDFLLSLGGVVISIGTALIVAWITFKSGWK